jgi:hypothetical protein
MKRTTVDYNIHHQPPSRRTRKSSDSKTPWGWIIGGVVVVAILVVLSWGSLALVHAYYAKHTVVATVTSKERVCDSGNKGCKYLVFTDRGTFKVTDSLLIGRFDSSDIYGQIQANTTYKITYFGWRIGLFSSYPNIDHLVKQP